MLSRADSAAIASYDNLDPYGGADGVATVVSGEDGGPTDSVDCPAEDGVWAFQEECRRIKVLRERDKTLGPVVVRLLFGDQEEMREVV